MKQILSVISIATALCLLPACKKSEVEPAAAAAKTTSTTDTASLYVLIDSDPCDSSQSQSEYSSATIDFRGIKVFSPEHGWQELTPVPGAWDVVSLQTAPVPVAEITEVTRVNAGAITKIMLTVGDNNKLVVNGHGADCYTIGTKEITLELEGEIKADALNEIVLSIDICGNFTVEQRYQQDPCYTLNPEMAFQSIIQR